MTTNQRMSQHEIHLSILDKYGDADFCMCKTCRPETRSCSPWIICHYDDQDNCLCTAIELVRANNSNSDGVNDDVPDRNHPNPACRGCRPRHPTHHHTIHKKHRHSHHAHTSTPHVSVGGMKSNVHSHAHTKLFEEFEVWRKKQLWEDIIHGRIE